MSEFDPELVRVLLGSAQRYGSALQRLETQAAETQAALDAARAQAAPHNIGPTDLIVHSSCYGRGCAGCGNSGVVHASTAAPLHAQAAPAQACAVVSLEAQRVAAEQARRRLLELASVFGAVADELNSASSRARRLAGFFGDLAK